MTRNARLYPVAILFFLAFLSLLLPGSATIQKEYHINLGGHETTGVDVAIAQGAEYKFTVDDAPSTGTWNWWTTPAQQGVLTNNGSTATWEPPETPGQCTIHVKWTPPPGGGEGPPPQTEADWLAKVHLPVVDVLYPNVDIEVSTSTDPDTAPKVTVVAVATCPTATGSPSHPLQSISMHWLEQHGHGEDPPSQWATLTGSPTTTNTSGHASIELTCSKTVADWHYVKAAVKKGDTIKGEDTSGKITVSGRILHYIVVFPSDSPPPPHPSSKTVAVTRTQDFNAWGYNYGADNEDDNTYPDDIKLAIQVSWTLEDKQPSDVGTIDSNGTFKADKEGICKAKATWTDPDNPGTTKTDTIDITTLAVDCLTVTPSSATLCIGSNLDFTVKAWNNGPNNQCDNGQSDDIDLSAYGVKAEANWTLIDSNPQGVGRLSVSTAAEKTTFYAEKSGTVTLHASYEVKTADAAVTVPGVEITNADVTQGPDGNIQVNLTPAGLSGTLTLQLLDPGTHPIFQNQPRASGSYPETFNITQLTLGEYKKVEATWTAAGVACSGERLYHIKVLGNYNHTCYITPDESGCTGSLQWYSYVIANVQNPCGPAPPCNWQNAQGKTGWLDAIMDEDAGAGSGKAVDGSIYVREWVCTGNPYSPKFRRTGRTCPDCGGAPLAEGDVAIKSNHPAGLKCGDKLFVHGKGLHVVRDTGDFASTKLDHYSGIAGCGDCTPPGDGLMTIKLFN